MTKLMKNIIFAFCMLAAGFIAALPDASAQQLKAPDKDFGQTFDPTKPAIKISGGSGSAQKDNGGKKVLTGPVDPAKQPDGQKSGLEKVTGEFQKGIDSIIENSGASGETPAPLWDMKQKSTDCKNDYNPRTSDRMPDAQGVFDDQILVDMQTFMQQVYLQLSKVMIIGHGLMCFAQNAAAFHIPVADVNIPDFSLLISGAVIYVVGALMAMCMGMYFVDISFKLGFAMLFLPVSIALWPFPPTKNKFTDNLSIIIRNAMLFVLVAVGVVFAVVLISNGVLTNSNGTDGWQNFWKAMGDESAQDLVEDSFSFTSLHFLTVAFALIFGFKILASSVNDYLDYFFSDSVFGSESPMHMMGTQAVGMAYANAVKPAAAFVGDVAKTQAGRGIAGLGRGVSMMATSEGRSKLGNNIKNAGRSVGNAVIHPRQTYNRAMGALGRGAGKVTGGVVKTGGKIVGGALDAVRHTATGLTFAMPTTETFRKKTEDKIQGLKNVSDAVNNLAGRGADFVSAKTENAIAHGGSQLAATAATAGKIVTGKYHGIEDAVTADDVHRFTDRASQSVHEDLSHGGRKLRQEAADKAASAVAAGLNMTGAGAGVTGEDVKGAISRSARDIGEKAQFAAQMTKFAAQAAGSRLADTKAGRFMIERARETVEAYKTSDQAPATLQPSAIISNALRVKAGQIFFRTLKGTKDDAKKLGEGTASVLGNLLQNFGESLQQNGNKEQRKYKTWAQMEESRKAKQAAAEDERSYYSSLSDKYQNDK